MSAEHRSARPLLRWVSTAMLVGLLAALAIIFFTSVDSSSARSLYVSMAGQDAAGCGSHRTPCASFQGAFRKARAGDIVMIEAGTYPGQTLERGPRVPLTEPVVFRAAPGAHVRISGTIYVFTSHLVLKRLHVADVTIGNFDQTPGRPDPSDVTLENIWGRNFEIDSASNVTIRGGSWGPASACGGPYGGGNNSIRDVTGLDPTNILITGVTIHDVQSYDLVACHIEGLAIFAGRNVVVSNSRFYGDSVYDAFVQANSGPISGLTFAGNWMAMPVGADGRQNGTVIGFSSISSNVLLKDNRFNYIVSLDDDGVRPTFSNFVLTGNVGILPYNACSLRGITWIHNLWQNLACSRSDANLHGRRLPYVNPVNTGALNYTLRPPTKPKRRKQRQHS